MPDPGTIWRTQDAEPFPIATERFLMGQARELDSAMRSEVLGGIAAVIFLAVVLVWRLPSQIAPRAAVLALSAVWLAGSIYRFRNLIWPRREAITEPCLRYYREQLERRRRQLRDTWLWHGPLLLACLALAGIAFFPGYARLLRAWPLILVLLLWSAYSLRRRLSQARQCQKEIEEIDRYGQ